ncbi:hypothetical protein Pan258_07790 [Symmachiella dynata]|uniref:hypothetical protein n=1 Tax=Symmachiella dynata TaxID=2527995 RepID=UPI00118910C4|nr:hypothetical protein [Symmachiella dynata]QDT46759.1 hypothetical protein Pan258_07790 [Symmachiella dynata]
MSNNAYARRNLVLSDFVISRMKSYIRDSFDFWVEWQQINAFNGTLLANHNTRCQLMFFDKLAPDIDGRGTNARFWSSDALAVSGYVEATALSTITHDEFNKLMSEAESDFSGMESNRYSKVSRIHAWAHFDNKLGPANALASELFSELAKSLGGSYIPEPKLTAQWVNPQLPESIQQEIKSGMLSEKEADICFDSAVEFDDLITNLERVALTECSFLTGNTIDIDPNSSRSLQQHGVLNIRIIARHF